jgi:putative ABC transport system permease protein
MTLAGIAGLVATGIGTLAAWITTTQVMEVAFTFSIGSVLGALGLAVGMVLGFGLIGSWRVLAERPVPYLRAE